MFNTLQNHIIVRTVTVVICACALLSCGAGALAAEVKESGGETMVLAAEDTPRSMNPPESGANAGKTPAEIKTTLQAANGYTYAGNGAPGKPQAAPHEPANGPAGPTGPTLAATAPAVGISTRVSASAQVAANPQASGYYSPTSPFGGINWPVGCTRYAWGRAYEKLGVRIPVRYSAGSWINEARAAGVATGMTPRSNSVAVWSGHVAFVESVSGDSVYLTEGGWSPGNGNYQGNPYWHEETTTAGVMANRHGQALLGYIYVDNQAAAKVKVRKVKLNITARTLAVGSTFTLKAKVSPSNAANKKITWKSSNNNVVKVSSKGKLKALKKGKVTITAKAKDGSGKKATCKVYVGARVKSVQLQTTLKVLRKGQGYSLKKKISPANAANKNVTWRSGNSKVATVSAKGRVKAKKNGKATITCTTQDGKKKAICKIIVGTPVQAVTLSAGSKTLNTGESFTLNSTVKPKGASQKAVSWVSSNKNVATVTSKGKVTAKGRGRATITCAAKDGSGKKAKCTVTVTQPVVSVSLNTGNVELQVGESFKLLKTVRPDNANDAGQVWESSAPSVATVDSEGVVTAGDVGVATVTVTTGEKSAECTVTVTRDAL